MLCQVQQVEGQNDQPFGRAAQWVKNGGIKIGRWTEGRVKGAPGLLLEIPRQEAIRL